MNTHLASSKFVTLPLDVKSLFTNVPIQGLCIVWGKGCVNFIYHQN